MANTQLTNKDLSNMRSNRITRLPRWLKDSFTALLMGVGILLPPPESAKAANPSATPDKQTIEQRVDKVRSYLHNQELRENANRDKSDQTSNERLTQWPNWTNWNNWNPWSNW
jgi:hypothetical protein